MFFRKYILEIITVLLFAILTIWWGILFFVFSATLSYPNMIWAAFYQTMAVWGMFWGFIISYKWGGVKSVFGRAILLLATGMLFQVIGQSTFSFYGLFLNVEIPYPSFADLGFFGSVIFYILGVLELYKLSGATFSFKATKNKLWAVFLPAAMLAVSYVLFLRSYEFDWNNPLIVFLDFGYPFGEAIYVSIAILVYLLSKHVLGGMMRIPILMILFALVAQYVAEFNFLYTFLNETWINGGYGDFLYLLSYFVMSYSLIYTGTMLRKIKQS